MKWKEASGLVCDFSLALLASQPWLVLPLRPLQTFKFFRSSLLLLLLPHINIELQSINSAKHHQTSTQYTTQLGSSHTSTSSPPCESSDLAAGSPPALTDRQQIPLQTTNMVNFSQLFTLALAGSAAAVHIDFKSVTSSPHSSPSSSPLTGEQTLRGPQL